MKDTLSSMKRRILVVEDEEKLRRVLELQLASAGFEVEKARTAEEALKVADRADLVLTDLRLPQMDGLELLAAIRRQNSQTPVIVMTAFGTIETAVEAMKTGATDFLLKPFSLDHLMTVVQKALEMRALRDENLQLREELGRRYEVRQHRGTQRADAGDFRDDHAGGADAGDGAAGGRERSGQGPDRAGHPFPFAAPGPAAGEDQLHVDPGEPDGERAVRLREGRFHGGA